MTRAERSRLRLLFLFLFAGLVAWGCNLVVGSGSLEFRDQDDGAAPIEGGGNDAQTDGGCENPTGNGGLGCYNCTPETQLEYFNSCTTNACEPFNDGTRGATDPGSRPLPSPPDSGTAPPGADAGITEICNDLPNPVFVTGASFSPVFLGKIAQSLAGQNVSLVFYNAVSCTAFNNVLTGTPISGQAFHWSSDVTLDPTQSVNQLPCVINAGTQPDIAVSDVFGTTCQDFPAGNLPTSIMDTFGPVQAMGFAVPTGSNQRSISAAAAYNVYGFGMDSKVEPWTNPAAMFQRGASSGTQNLVAAAIGLKPALWFGVFENSTADMTTALISSGGKDQTTANETIGIVSSDVVIARSDQLRLLAFQGPGQTCGFYPDSTANAHDRTNVRDGRYALWGPYHFFTKSTISNPNVQTVLNEATGTAQVPGVDLLSLYAQKGLTPQCAMHVARTKDGGGLIAFKPDISCSCYFDSITGGQASCKTCKSASDCTSDAPNCNIFNGSGFCEP